MTAPTPWHRLFGIALTDLFAGRPWRVELEKELALKGQRLDVLIIERLPGQAAGRDPALWHDLPDGLEGLSGHNVLSFKSKQETLDAWALDELLGHYVTYRKLASMEAVQGPAPASEPAEAPGADVRLLPAADFRLYAVATRRPAKLLSQLHPSARRSGACPGVYDLHWGSRDIRLIVLNDLTQHPRNAAWELFASEVGRIRYGLTHYRPRCAAAELLRYHLANVYRLELPDMAYTLDDFKHDTWRLLIEEVNELSREERQALLERMDVEDRLRGLAAEDRLRGLDAEERLRGLAAEERLQGLDPKLVEEWLRRIKH